MTMKPTDRGTLRLAVAVSLAVALGLGAAAIPFYLSAAPSVADQPPSPDVWIPPHAEPVNATRLTSAVQTWNWTGFEGNLTLDLQDVGWVDIAYPVDPVRDMATVEASWRYTVEVDGDGSPFWQCASMGVWTREQYEQHELGPLAGPGGKLVCLGQAGDGMTEVDARLGGERVNASTRDPGYRVVGPYTRDIDETMEGPLFSINPEVQSAPPRPVEHFTLATGGEPLEEGAVLRFAWTNTTVRVRTGPPGDTFAAQREDFETDRYVQADHPGTFSSTTVAGNGTYRTELVRDRPHAVFWWLPPEQEGSQGEPGYRRPNGSVYPPEYLPSAAAGGLWAEATDDVGPWTFWIPAGRSGEPDRPVLMGARYERAAFPWQSPHFDQS